MFGDFEWQAQRKMRRAEISKYAKTTRTFRRTVKVAALKTHTLCVRHHSLMTLKLIYDFLIMRKFSKCKSMENLISENQRTQK